MKVLVVEDDAVVADFIAKGLREEGHAVDVAPDGDQGLYLAMSESYDVLIVDRMLPGVDGLGIIRALAEPRTIPRRSSCSAPWRTCRSGSRD